MRNLFQEARGRVETHDFDSCGCIGDRVIRTVTGKSVDLKSPSPADICLDDIAIGLSRICRFGGQLHKHYSVAEHSVACAENAIREGNTPDVVMQVLFHDAAEAYLGDVVRPVKVAIRDVYGPLEQLMDTVIAVRFGMQASKPSWMRSAIKVHDQAICREEMIWLTPETYREAETSFSETLGQYRADWFVPKCLPPRRAEEKFRKLYSRIVGLDYERTGITFDAAEAQK